VSAKDALSTSIFAHFDQLHILSYKLPTIKGVIKQEINQQQKIRLRA
jgi:hypothetical protein